MHRVDIWPEALRLRKPAPHSARCIVIGHGRPQLIINPQVNGTGYGITITTMEGRVLLTADITAPITSKTGVCEVAKRTTYKLYPRKRK